MTGRQDDLRTRATIIVALDVGEEVQAAKRWFADWRSMLTHVSENEGCGCCVDIYNVEGPAAAIAAIPSGLRSDSDWSNGEVT